MTEKAAALAKVTLTVFGSRPVHRHFDPSSAQEWDCNSPYCTDLNLPHPDNGGPAPVVMGYEPWRR